MKISFVAEGLLDPRQLTAWTQARRDAIRKAVAAGMASGGREVADRARAQMRAALNVKRQSFVKSLRAKVLDAKPERLPALLIGSRVPWLGIHERGGSIGGNMLIPLLPGRIGRKRFKAIVDALMRSGNAFFVKKGSKTILMAENIQENAAELSRFKRAERRRSGDKRLKRGREIPIAVLVKSVTLKKRLDLEGTVRTHLPVIARAIERELGE